MISRAAWKFSVAELRVETLARYPDGPVVVVLKEQRCAGVSGGQDEEKEKVEMSRIRAAKHDASASFLSDLQRGGERSLTAARNATDDARILGEIKKLLEEIEALKAKHKKEF